MPKYEKELTFSSKLPPVEITIESILDENCFEDEGRWTKLFHRFQKNFGGHLLFLNVAASSHGNDQHS